MVELSGRKLAILEAIARCYVETAEPVSSRQLLGRLPFSVSSATIRNDMMALEEEGLLSQPHVSAGRFPTVEAFRLLASRLLLDTERDNANLRVRAEAFLDDPFDAARRLARRTSATAAVVAGETLSFAGFEFVLGAPELREDEPREAFAHLIDEAPRWEERLREALDTQIGVFIADENPIASTAYFSIIAARLPKRGVVTIVGPIRMDYALAFSALRRMLR